MSRDHRAARSGRAKECEPRISPGEDKKNKKEIV